MARKKKVIEPKIEMMTVRVLGPHCYYGNRKIQPGETATVPAGLAREWILTVRAIEVAEVKKL